MEKVPPLWKHQQDCLEKSRTINDMALFHDLGTGKSRSTIEIMRDKYNNNKKILRTLIICPSAILEKWKREIMKYSAIPGSKIHVLDGSLLDRAKQYQEKDGIFITNTEAFAFEKFTSVVIKNPPNICIVDESHKFKDISAKRTKALIKVSLEMEKLKVHHRYILTGSPVLNTQQDLFSQFYFLDAGKTFGKNFYAFRGTYFRDSNEFIRHKVNFANWVVRAGAEEALKAKIAPIVTLADKSLCLDLPPLLRTEIDVTMSSEQRKAYEEMKKDFITFVENKGVAIANLALTKALRMQQVLSGFLKLEGGEIHRFKDNPRAKVLSDLLEDIVPTQKVIVWCIFHEDFHTVKEVLKKLELTYAEVTGLVSDKEAEMHKFDTDKNCRVMLASQSAGGTGCEMIQASTMIYYSRGYSYEHDFQSEARNFRGGSEIHDKITRIDLIARGTLDEIVLQALRDKKNLATNILALKDLL
jgi:SNF2 family DNA or RNA helicase